MKTDEFLSLAIPKEIRELQHQDGELIRACLVSALSAYHGSRGTWDKTIAGDIHKHLMVTLEKEILPHLSKEDEDWNGLKGKAEQAEAMMASSAADMAKAQEIIRDRERKARAAKRSKLMSDPEFLKGMEWAREFMDDPSGSPSAEIAIDSAASNGYSEAFQAGVREYFA